MVGRTEHEMWLIVVDSWERMRSGFKGTDTLESHILHLVSEGTPLELLTFLQREEIPYLMAGKKKVDVCRVMEKMKTKL